MFVCWETEPAAAWSPWCFFGWLLALVTACEDCSRRTETFCCNGDDTLTSGLSWCTAQMLLMTPSCLQNRLALCRVRQPDFAPVGPQLLRADPEETHPRFHLSDEGLFLMAADSLALPDQHSLSQPIKGFTLMVLFSC